MSQAGAESPQPPETESGDSAFVVELGAFEGPVDLLLSLAREQKVDLAQISVLALAEQYLAYIARAQALRLELRADYLVMAAWLAFLKSRLLVPQEEQAGDDAEEGESMAEALQFQLRRLEAMQRAGQKLLQRPRLGRDVFPRGQPEGVSERTKPAFQLSLYELLQAYGRHRLRQAPPELRIERAELFAVEEAMERLQNQLGRLRAGWHDLMSLLPPELRSGGEHGPGSLRYRSAIASTLAASLEMAREGKLALAQPDGPFSAIQVRVPDGEEPG